MNNIFKDNAYLYHENNLSVLPVGGKIPIPSGFDKYWKEKVSDDTLEQWESEFPSANIGLICGQINGIFAFDYDYTGDGCQELEQIIIDILPPTPAIKSSRKGKWTRFYRIDSDVKTSGYSLKSVNIVNGKSKSKTVRVYDTLGHGRQTVIPPSIHPDTKQPYFWEGPPLLECFDDIPFIDPSILMVIKESTDLFFSSEKSTGRNSALFAYAYKCIHEHSSFDSWKSALDKYDVTKFSNNSYFNDPDERKRKSKDEFLDAMAKSWLASITRLKKEHQGINFSFIKSTSDELFLESQYADKIKARYKSSENGFLEVIETPGAKDQLIPKYIEYSKFCREVRGLKIYKEKYIYIYDGAKYISIEKMNLKKIISKDIFNWATPNYIENYFKRVMIDAQKLGDEPRPPDGFINFGDKIYNIYEDAMIPRTKDLFFKSVLPIAYDKDAKCDNFIEFLNDIFDKDQELISAVQKMFGYILIGGEPFLQKAFVLIGSGRNGKGVLIKLLKMILGEYYSVVSMAKINESFSAINLDGVYANIVEESPETIDSEAFKNLVGGGEVQAGQKNKPEYRFKVNARFVFACNDFPYFKDKNNSMNSRLFIIPFNKTYIEGHNMDPLLFEKLSLESSGILNWAIKGAHQVIKDRKIDQPQSSLDMKEEYREGSDQVYAWCKEELSIGIENKEGIPTAQLYVYYKIWAEDRGSQILSQDSFSKRLSRLIKEKLGSGFKAERFDEDSGQSGQGRRVRTMGYKCITVLRQQEMDKRIAKKKYNDFMHS